MEARLLGRKLIFLLASDRFPGIIAAREVAPMRLSDSISSILKHKGTRLLTVAPSAVVYEAIAMMAETVWVPCWWWKMDSWSAFSVSATTPAR